jgi:hypothetical protein
MKRAERGYWAVKKLLTLEKHPMQNLSRKDTEITPRQGGVFGDSGEYLNSGEWIRIMN